MGHFDGGKFNKDSGVLSYNYLGGKGKQNINIIKKVGKKKFLDTYF